MPGPRSPDTDTGCTLCDAVVTPTVTCSAGTLHQESTKKRSALPNVGFVVSSFRRREHTKKRTKKTDQGGKVIQNDEMSEDAQEEDSTDYDFDQDSSVSFEDDTESTSSQEDELEDWIEH